MSNPARRSVSDRMGRFSLLLALALLAPWHVSPTFAVTPRQMEALGRGVVALRQDDGTVFVSWRLLGTDPDDIAFNVYRSTGDTPALKCNDEPIKTSTCFVDKGVDLNRPNAYHVRPVLRGQEQSPSAAFRLDADSPARNYLSIPLQTPDGYHANDAAVGDLDGDGEYEIVLKLEMRGFDNSRRGVCPGTTKLDAYKLDGTLLWRIDLGRNIREGAHYTPFVVYDLDGDGRAEVAVRTAEGTVDGTGATIGDIDGDGRTDYVNPRTGYILEGPEFLSLFDGKSGKELARTDYIPRGRVSDWGDDYGNRVDRFLMGVGYFDGIHPSVVMCRGYYTITRLEAWNWRDGSLKRLWRFDSRSRPDWLEYEGQGNHNLSIGDLDDDGSDEIVYGAMCLDHDGTPLYNTKLGHGDAIHLSDIDPDRPGLEVFDIHERPRHPFGAEFRDARTGEPIWGKASPDVGRGLAIDVDPRYRGYEMWASGPGLNGLWNVKGETISERKPRSCNFGVWWDGDLLREILDRARITKWNWRDGTETTLLNAHGCASNNSTKATPCLCADILGDWREEVLWRSTDRKELRIYSTTIPTAHRLYTLMHDPIYRISVALQNVGYNQPTQTGFYLGDGMSPPPRPAILNKAQ